MGRKRAFLLFTTACLTLSLFSFQAPPIVGLASGSQGDPAQALERRVDVVARRSLSDMPLAGISLAVIRNGRLEVAKAYGFADLQNKVRARPGTIYRTGSVGKQFTAATLMRLAEQNKLSLDDPLGQYLPEFPRRLHRITIRQLLSHTAGLRELNADGRFARSQGIGMTSGEVVRLAGQQPLEFEPGERFSYSNTGYIIAAAIIERATGRPAAAYITREVLRPLGLTDSSGCRPHKSRLAQGYDVGPDRGWHRAVRLGRFPALVAPRAINLRAISGAGAFCSTPADLVRWTQKLHHGEVLTPESLKEMTEAAVLADGQRAPYGLGTQIRSYGDRRALGHAGIIWGFNAVVAHFPGDDLSVAMMVNTLLPEQTGKRLWEEFLGAIYDERPAEWKEPGYDGAPRTSS